MGRCASAQLSTGVRALRKPTKTLGPAGTTNPALKTALRASQSTHSPTQIATRRAQRAGRGAGAGVGSGGLSHEELELSDMGSVRLNVRLNALF